MRGGFTVAEQMKDGPCFMRWSRRYKYLVGLSYSFIFKSCFVLLPSTKTKENYTNALSAKAEPLVRLNDTLVVARQEAHVHGM